jgi:hypothetical protein
VTTTTTTTTSPTKRHTKKKKKKTFDWEPSQSALDENKLILAELTAAGLRLHHVTMQGDSVFERTRSNPSIFSSSDQQVESLHNVASTLLRRIFLSQDEGTMDDTIQLQNVPLTNREDVVRGRRTPSSISALPRSILLAGRSIRTLNLENCNLACLPASFGLYLPNLVVRSIGTRYSHHVGWIARTSISAQSHMIVSFSFWSFRYSIFRETT